MKKLHIDGHKVKYEVLGRYKETEFEIIRFYNPGGIGSEPLDVIVLRINGETDVAMATRAFNYIRMW